MGDPLLLPLPPDRVGLVAAGDKVIMQARGETATVQIVRVYPDTSGRWWMELSVTPGAVADAIRAMMQSMRIEIARTDDEVPRG